ncbi:MAG: acetyl-CoA carboxylase biotin carboxyl carrier protein [Acidobacteria bacterium]|nr:acetyl-CoA carboxylase biotin carboxyl carrier protein [Acidobacteriota bacterium]
MNLDDIKELLKAVTDSDVTELEVELDEAKVRIRRGAPERESAPQPPYVVVASGAMPAGVTAPALGPGPVPQPGPTPKASPETPEASEDDGLTLVPSPIVGTFYESSAPGSPSFVEVGDKVAVGQVLCIIEAMKLMNEIESEVAGVVVKRFVANAQPVEYGQSLFAIRPVGA